MTDVLDAARKVIQSRISEIEAEMKKLKDALESLGDPGSRPTGRRRRRAPGGPRGTSNGRRKIAPRGQRRKQLLSHLEKNPGAKPSEIAKALDISPANVQNVLRTARKDKLVAKRRGGGYALGQGAKAANGGS